MILDSDEEETTVQEVGPPVPARGESGSAGSLGSSSIDGNVEAVGCMTKKSVLERSPTLINGNTDSEGNIDPGTPKNIAYHEYMYNEKTGTSVKRKRLDPQYSEESWRKEIASTEKAANAFRKSFRKIDTEVGNLSKLVRGNTNTKREIKDVTNKLKSLMKAVKSPEMQDLLQTLGTQQNRPNYDTISALTEEIQERKEKEEELIREIEKDKKEKEEIVVELGRIKEDAERLKRILISRKFTDYYYYYYIPVNREYITKVKNYQDFLNCVDRDWTEDAYQNTKIKLGSVNQSKTDQDIAVWCSRKDEDAKEENWIETLLQFPDLTEIEEDVGTDRRRYYVDLNQNAEKMVKKRKCVDPSPQSTLFKVEPNLTISKLLQKVEKIVKFKNDNKSVHKEIKTGIMEILDLVNKVSKENVKEREEKELLENMLQKANDVLTKKHEELDAVKMENAEVRKKEKETEQIIKRLELKYNEETKNNSEKIRRLQRLLDEAKTMKGGTALQEKINKRLEEKIDFQTFWELKDDLWPEECFNKTNIFRTPAK
ncbi:hypothetical protein FQR65_LT01634 [Abscondita terminalis]|nr:hypothetical protein FQR65_LT01634 [Abscondita terminalis]